LDNDFSELVENYIAKKGYKYNAVNTLVNNIALSNPTLDKDKIKETLFNVISTQYDISQNFFDNIWGQVERTGILDKIIEKKAKEELPGLFQYSLDELEGMVSDDSIKNNMLALEMIKHPNFNRELINKLYNGLGVVVKMGKEGTYGEGIKLKRKLNMQQFYTFSEVSKIMKQMLAINEFARVWDPTCGSGRLFWYMPNQEMCHGIELEHDAYIIAKALYPKAKIIQDTIVSHIHEDAFDYVVANPPFTLYWSDKQRIFKFANLYKNELLSELAVFETSIRSLRDGGYLAIIMPANVWIDKFMDKLKFVDWLKDEIDCIAKIELPTHTHEGTVYPTSLYIYKKTHVHKEGWSWKEEDRLPRWRFMYKLDSYEDTELDAMMKVFKKTDMWGPIIRYSEGIENQDSFELKVVEVREISRREYIRTATSIVSEDAIELDTELKEIDTFILPPVTLTPNGLHADLKINALRTFYGTKWSPSRKAYIDLFKELATLDVFLDERRKYDDLPLIKGIHSYDCIVNHSQQFMNALGKRKEWIDFQDTPLEIWVDQNGDFNWEHIYEGRSYKDIYPKIWAKWQQKFDILQLSPLYEIYLPHLNRKDNWLKHLFNFQKNDVMRMAMKASIINVSSMGLGKTREAIATALLKGFDHNLIVCRSGLITTWKDEFKQLGLSEPFVVTYNDDLKEILNHQFVIVNLKTLIAKKDRPRPIEIKKNPPESDNYDYPSILQTDNNIAEMLRAMDFTESEIDDIVYLPETTYSTNPKKGESEESKEMKKFKELQTIPMFVDNLSEKFGFMIVDEAHDLSNPIAKQTQAVWRLKPKHLLFMTGTPIKNRVKGLLSLLIMGWGEETIAMPYNKETFLEHFMQMKEIEYETVDSHGYIRKKTKEVEIPQIANPDDLRTLMAGKWLRRTKYEPDVAADRKFPVPTIMWKEFEPSLEEIAYSKQWYDEWLRLKMEIEKAREQLKSLRATRQSGWGFTEEDAKKISELEAELKVKSGIAMVMITKLRAVAIAPQIEWLDTRTDDDKYDKPSALMRVIKIPERYKGGITPRQEYIINELKKRVKKGEQCYTICHFPLVNHRILKPELEKYDIKAEIIDGGVKMAYRDDIIDQFRNGKVDVILATAGTFDVGINIPSASYCAIIMPEWNWTDMEQAYSRMIRPQSKGERAVEILFLKGSIEDYVRQLAEMKRFNQEYVIDYGLRPPDTVWYSWGDAIQAMFVDLKRGDFAV